MYPWPSTRRPWQHSQLSDDTINNSTLRLSVIPSVYPPVTFCFSDWLTRENWGHLTPDNLTLKSPSLLNHLFMFFHLVIFEETSAIITCPTPAPEDSPHCSCHQGKQHSLPGLYSGRYTASLAIIYQSQSSSDHTMVHCHLIYLQSPNTQHSGHNRRGGGSQKLAFTDQQWLDKWCYNGQGEKESEMAG